MGWTGKILTDSSDVINDYRKFLLLIESSWVGLVKFSQTQTGAVWKPISDELLTKLGIKNTRGSIKRTVHNVNVTSTSPCTEIIQYNLSQVYITLNIGQS